MYTLADCLEGRILGGRSMQKEESGSVKQDVYRIADEIQIDIS